MKLPRPFNAEQTAGLARTFWAGKPPHCPECGTRLDERSVPPRADVSYVRNRVWLVCPACHRTAVIDRREPGHA